MEAPPETLKIAQLIKDMRIRGAGRIARAAAYSLKLAALRFKGGSLEDFNVYMSAVAEIIGSTRPTAVSLHNALRYVLNRVRKAQNVHEAIQFAINAADLFIGLSLNSVKLIGEIGSKLIEDGDTVLTHCNSAAALSVLKTAHKAGKHINVYATETRPKFQGLISYRELERAGIPTTLIPDSSVRFFMKDVDKVVVGADTVTANGAVVNKVGTSQIALAAYEASVRVYIATETYKFSPATILGEPVIIEEREGEEIVPKTLIFSRPNLKVRNPAFDVTPPDYIDAIITEQGIIPPKAASLILLEDYGATLAEELANITLDLEDVAYLTF
ncbi:MAG: ribose 1,5-bisphosphate isomerase [Thermofilaceae archaeon]|nr:ribose 1,5-bisphosphate isomerase [Thermofilaceae archaeon]